MMLSVRILESFLLPFRLLYNLQSSLSGPLWLELLLFSSSLPQSLSSVVFCIPSSSVLRAFGSPALALQVNSEIVVKRMRIVRILYSHGMYYIIQQILLHFQACHGLVRPVNAKLLVLPVTFYLSEIDNSLTCFCFYCSFY